MCSECGEGARYPARRARTLEVHDVDTTFLEVERVCATKSLIDGVQFAVRHAFLARVVPRLQELGRHVGGDGDREWESTVVTQHSVTAEAAVGRHRSAASHQDEVGPEAGRRQDHVPHTLARGSQGILARGTRQQVASDDVGYFKDGREAGG